MSPHDKKCTHYSEISRPVERLEKVIPINALGVKRRGECSPLAQALTRPFTSTARGSADSHGRRTTAGLTTQPVLCGRYTSPAPRSTEKKHRRDSKQSAGKSGAESCLES
ncbi:hypothetical protein ACJJTC_002377 [Scirpophaga incertulas]